MTQFRVTSNYGHIDFGFFYIGWNNSPTASVNDDCGDEIFGVGFGNWYAGYYSDGKWCAGFLDQFGCLK